MLIFLYYSDYTLITSSHRIRVYSSSHTRNNPYEQRLHLMLILTVSVGTVIQVSLYWPGLRTGYQVYTLDPYLYYLLHPSIDIASKSILGLLMLILSYL